MNDNKIFQLHLYFEESRNRNRLLKLSPFSMTGDKIEGYHHKKITKYKIEIKNSEVKNSCKKYKSGQSEDKCNEKLSMKSINSTLGCLPFSLTKNLDKGPGHYCRGHPNGSVVTYKNIIQRLANYLPYPICEPACSYYQYNAVEVQYQLADSSIIELVFDDTIYVTKSKYEFTFFPILTTLGGQIGLCRTVVWLGLSVMGLNKIFLAWSGMCRAPLAMQTQSIDE